MIEFAWTKENNSGQFRKQYWSVVKRKLLTILLILYLGYYVPTFVVSVLDFYVQDFAMCVYINITT